MGNSKMLKDGMLLGALYIVSLLITLILPGIELLTIFILPIPFVVFSAKYGWRPSSIVFFFVLCISLFISSVSIPFTIVAGIGGIMVGLAIYQKLTAYETWARGTLGFVISFLVVFILIQVLFSVNLIEQFSLTIDESLETSKQILEGFGMETSEEVLEQLEEQMYQILNLIPFILVMAAMLIGFISQWISYKILNRIKGNKLYFPVFRDFKLPKVMIWIFFFAILLTLFPMEQGSMMYLGVMNVFHLAGLLIVLQGYSFILFYAHKKGISIAIPIIAIIFSIIIPFIGLYIIRILGIIDLGFSLRDRISNSK
ncbi:YybS family protein [Aquibacillus rhizosphaerae]|uniref:DUF2232 domain-containing protein n=1 Tax=Aquibacillus rhizosphaerae TaxID=3051431 RepID=A0ABT7L509_9BACI|nr:DUF2232 domain-containing protein [Aquibacillus sp. LR5S19]MDL4840948.1 DUF2232 domain-containing protein [Aquibacillus sp. LR5S19]